MKTAFILFSLFLSLQVVAAEPSQEWESLDLEESHLKEMEEEHRRKYEDREGDLQIQAEEEEIIPLESEDSKYLQQSSPEED